MSDTSFEYMARSQGVDLLIYIMLVHVCTVMITVVENLEIC